MELKTISTVKIRGNPFQPRQAFDEEALRELADSIRETRIVQPIIVKRQGENYEIIAGERRWGAAQMAGLRQIPCIVEDISEDRVLLESLVENLHRKDLADIERENAIHQLWKSGMFNTKEALAKAIGVPRERVVKDIEAKEFRDAEKLSVERARRAHLFSAKTI